MCSIESMHSCTSWVFLLGISTATSAEPAIEPPAPLRATVPAPMRWAAARARVTLMEFPLVLMPSTTSCGPASPSTCRAKTSSYP